MKIAKIDSNNKVVDVHILKVEKCIDKSTGSCTHHSVNAVSTKLWGEGYTYKCDMHTNTSPEIGQEYHAASNSFRDIRPTDIEGVECASWTYSNTEFEWQAPHQYGANGTITMKKFHWRESNASWYAQRAGVEHNTWWTWNNSTQSWTDTNSTEL